MKKLFIPLLLSLPMLAFSNNDFETAMQANLDKLKQATTVTELQTVANTFERIAAAEKKEWLPRYYAAYCYVLMTTLDEELAHWDGYLDTALALLEQSEKVKKANKVEILALKGFVAMMRISVDPATRGQEYSMKSANYLQQAYQLEAQNPRVTMLMGHMLYGTAQFFGSSTDEACAKFAEALTLFEQEETTDTGIKPHWGKPEAKRMLAQCNSKSND